MKIAILGATSQIARDLIVSFSNLPDSVLHLFARRPNNLYPWLVSLGLQSRFTVADYSELPKHEYAAVINFVGAADPIQITELGSQVLDLTRTFDEVALNYQKHHPKCRYIFISSGAAYGSSFDEPANENTKAQININQIQPTEWYGLGKLTAECRHRAYANYPIVDLRVFNYFSRSSKLSARNFINDVIRSIKDKKILKTSSDDIVRDYLHPEDLFKLIKLVLSGPEINVAIDCYSKEPISKYELLGLAERNFGLRYEIFDREYPSISGKKPNYYSVNKIAETLGYFPKWSSADCIVNEAQLILGSTIS